MNYTKLLTTILYIFIFTSVSLFASYAIDTRGDLICMSEHCDEDADADADSDSGTDLSDTDGDPRDGQE